MVITSPDTNVPVKDVNAKGDENVKETVEEIRWEDHNY